MAERPKRAAANGVDISYVEDTGSQSEGNTEEDIPNNDPGTSMDTNSQDTSSQPPIKLATSLEEISDEYIQHLARHQFAPRPSRETTETAKDDTAVQFYKNQRGGDNVIFRGHMYYCKTKRDAKHYYTCFLKNCNATLILYDKVFHACSGEHDHPKLTEERMLRDERRREYLAKRKAGRERRLERIKKKEIDRIMQAQKQAEQAVAQDDPGSIELEKLDPRKRHHAKIKQRGLAPTVAPLSFDEIEQIPRKYLFQNEKFFEFDERLAKLFDSLKLVGIAIDGVDLNDLIARWADLKPRIRALSVKNDHRRDKRAKALKDRLEAVEAEKAKFASAKVDIEKHVSSLSDLVSKQLQELVNIKKRLNVAPVVPDPATILSSQADVERTDFLDSSESEDEEPAQPSRSKSATRRRPSASHATSNGTQAPSVQLNHNSTVNQSEVSMTVPQATQAPNYNMHQPIQQAAHQQMANHAVPSFVGHFTSGSATALSSINVPLTYDPNSGQWRM